MTASHDRGANWLVVAFIVLGRVCVVLYLAGHANAGSAVCTLAFFVNVEILFRGFR